MIAVAACKCRRELSEGKENKAGMIVQILLLVDQKVFSFLTPL